MDIINTGKSSQGMLHVHGAFRTIHPLHGDFKLCPSHLSPLPFQKSQAARSACIRRRRVPPRQAVHLPVPARSQRVYHSIDRACSAPVVWRRPDHNPTRQRRWLETFDCESPVFSTIAPTVSGPERSASKIESRDISEKPRNSLALSAVADRTRVDIRFPPSYYHIIN